MCVCVFAKIDCFISFTKSDSTHTNTHKFIHTYMYTFDMNSSGQPLYIDSRYTHLSCCLVDGKDLMQRYARGEIKPPTRLRLIFRKAAVEIDGLIVNQHNVLEIHSLAEIHRLQK